MKKFTGIMVLGAIVILASCGGNALEKKKAELEKLKTTLAETQSNIKTIEEEILAMGDTIKTNERLKIVAVNELKPQLFEHFIDVQGRVDGDENTTISARAMGPITSVLVKSGMQVKKGQVLALLDGEIVKRQLDDMKITLQFVTDVYNKQKALWDKQIGSEIQYLTAKNNKESMEQKLATLKEQLDMYSIKSPINGAIDEVFIKIGQNIAPGMPCFRVVNFGSLKVKADVAETYAENIHEGNSVILQFPDINREIKSTISFTARVINQTNRTFTIESKLPSDQTYIPNMITVMKVIDYTKANAIVVPINTVQTAEGHSHIFVAEMVDGKLLAKRRDIQVGKTYNDKAEVVSGLMPGDKLITVGYQDLNDNEIIKY